MTFPCRNKEIYLINKAAGFTNSSEFHSSFFLQSATCCQHVKLLSINCFFLTGPHPLTYVPRASTFQCQPCEPRSERLFTALLPHRPRISHSPGALRLDPDPPRRIVAQPLGVRDRVRCGPTRFHPRTQLSRRCHTPGFAGARGNIPCSFRTREEETS